MNGAQKRTLVSLLKNALDVLRYAKKGISQAEATSDSKNIKPVALVVIGFHWFEGIRQLVS